MKQLIEIDVPEGKVLKQDISKDGSLIFRYEDTKPEEPVRSMSWDEFCENHPDCCGEYYIGVRCDVTQCTRTNYRDKKSLRDLLESKEDAEGIIALIQLTRLHDEWVGDWKPNGEEHFCIYYNVLEKTEKINCFTTGSHLLSFPNIGMAFKFIGRFGELIERARKFI